jgi:hypothetical protein
MRKSPCCGAKVWSLSTRRRKCSKCLRRWRIRIKKRGRRKRRADHRLIDQVFLKQRSLTQLAAQRRLSRQTLSARFRNVLRSRSLELSGLTACSEQAILLVDGLWFRFKRRQWVLYLMALRPIEKNQAIFLDPVLLEGSESKRAWLKAIATIPEERRTHIRAIVGDKFSGCRTIARTNGWILQLCHFHLLAEFKGRIQRRSTTKGRFVRQEIFKLVQRALVTLDRVQLNAIIVCLKLLIADPDTPKRYKALVRGFLRTMDDYHAYLLYPDLRLPRTNGSSEAMGRRIRDLLYTTRSLSSTNALKIWVKNLVQIKPEIMCRPGILVPN